MTELFSLGELYPSDFLKPGESPRSGKIEMKLMMTSDGNIRLEKTAPSETMYGKYWYRSGINSSMKNELKRIVDSITQVYSLKENDIWLDIACNDGTLLSFVSENILKICVDPADDTYKEESEKHADHVIQNYFTATDFKKEFGTRKAKVVTSIAMFYDLEHPDRFLQDVNEVLDQDGLYVLQLSYTPLMLKQLAFDNIVHEHIFYYSLFNLKTLLKKNGFQIVDCQLNNTNGGSFRVYAMKDSANKSLFSTQPYRDVCDFRVKSLLEYEKSLNLDQIDTWMDFYDRMLNLKKKTVAFIKKVRSEGKSVWAYGASTKGNTLLQYFGLDNTLIDGIAERSIYKWDHRTVGTNIPIYSEDEMRKAKPDYLLILPWHFLSEFLDRESVLISQGTQFIVPCPQFSIIGK